MFKAGLTQSSNSLLVSFFAMDLFFQGLGLFNLLLEGCEPTIALGSAVGKENVLVAVELEENLAGSHCQPSRPVGLPASGMSS